MQVTQTLNEGLKRAFKIQIPNAEIAAQTDERLRAVAADLKLPGFRPGKVPLSVARQRVGQSVEAEVLERLINEKLGEILSENDLRPAFQPKVEIASDGREGRDLEFTAEIDVLPPVKLPDFKGIKLKRHTAPVKDEAVEASLQDLARRARRLEDVSEDRPAQKGDVLRVDFLGKKDGVPFEGGEGRDVDVELGGEGFIPGFSEQMIGMKPGDEKIIEVTFPEDYHAKELAGQKVTFDLKAKSLHAMAERKVDDELAAMVGLDSLDALKKHIREQIAAEYGQLSSLCLKRDLLDVLAARADFEVSPAMVENEFKQIWQRVEEERRAGHLDSEDAAKDEADLRREYGEIAERRVRLGLLLAELARTEKMEVTQEELLAALQQEARRFPGQEKQVFEFFTKNPQAVESLRGPILENKAVEHLLAQAEIENEEVAAELLEKLAAGERPSSGN